MIASCFVNDDLSFSSWLVWKDKSLKSTVTLQAGIRIGVNFNRTSRKCIAINSNNIKSDQRGNEEKTHKTLKDSIEPTKNLFGSYSFTPVTPKKPLIHYLQKSTHCIKPPMHEERAWERLSCLNEIHERTFYIKML